LRGAPHSTHPPCASLLCDPNPRLSQIPHIRPFPGKRSVVVLDNARIHRCRAFVRMVNRAGGMVLYLPPYCYDLTPLDNGAFGIVRRYLQKHSARIARVGLRRGLDKAFAGIRKRQAKYCFRNCGYHMMPP
jgi:hypothetical protein